MLTCVLYYFGDSIIIDIKILYSTSVRSERRKMSMRLDYTNQEVQSLIQIFCPEYHCLKIYNFANDVFSRCCECDAVLFKESIRKLVLIHKDKSLTLGEAFIICGK